MDYTKKDGAMWIKQSAKGTDYLSGTIKVNGEDMKFVAFTNKKGNEKHPDWNIYLSEERKEEKVVNIDDIPDLI